MGVNASDLAISLDFMTGREPPRRSRTYRDINWRTNSAELMRNAPFGAWTGAETQPLAIDPGLDQATRKAAERLQDFRRAKFSPIIGHEPIRAHRLDPLAAHDPDLIARVKIHREATVRVEARKRQVNRHPAGRFADPKTAGFPTFGVEDRHARIFKTNQFRGEQGRTTLSGVLVVRFPEAHSLLVSLKVFVGV